MVCSYVYVSLDENWINSTFRRFLHPIPLSESSNIAPLYRFIYLVCGSIMKPFLYVVAVV